MHHVPRTALCAVPGLRALLPGQCDALRQAEKDDVVQDRLAGPRLQQVVGQSRLDRAHAAQALCLATASALERPCSANTLYAPFRVSFS